MKISEEELIDEIESIRDSCQRTLDANHEMKLSQNNVMTGMLIGQIQMCEYFLDFIRNGPEE